MKASRTDAAAPLLARPYEATVAGWAVVFSSVVFVLAAGIVTNRMPTVIAVTVLAIPVLVGMVFSIVQWWQVHSSGADPASWWHLAGPAAAAFTWLAWPTGPGVLTAVGSARSACNQLGQDSRDCLTRAAHALDGRNIAWWLTGALIVAAALLTRRSRIAAWAAIPTAMAGSILAYHFLQLLASHYRLGG